jgi:hypothetical protein
MPIFRSALFALALMASPAWAQNENTGTVYYRAGNWEAFTRKTQDGGTFCGIRSILTADGRGLSIQFRIGGNELTLRAQKPSWQIPPDTQIGVTMQFAAHAIWQFAGRGEQDHAEWTIPPEGMAEFYARFRTGAILWIGFPGGSEAPWGISLAGSNAAGATLRRCIDEITQYMARTQPGTGPTQPFNGGPAQSMPSQPFAPSPASPVPTQPAAPTAEPAPTR